MLKGKNAIITGANRGIGKAIVKDYAENGANVFACARKKTEEFEKWCCDLSRKNSVEIIPVYFDMASGDEIKNAYKYIKEKKMPIDVLVNVAGVVFNANFQMTSIGKIQELFQINFYSQLQITQYVLKMMTKQKSGSVIFLSSSGAIDGNAGRTAYNSSKAAIISSALTLSKEVGMYGIRVNVIAPGLIDTDMARNYTPDKVMERELQLTCLKRLGSAKELAHVASFLGSDLSSFVTGQVWRVDGGM